MYRFTSVCSLLTIASGAPAVRQQDAALLKIAVGIHLEHEKLRGQRQPQSDQVNMRGAASILLFLQFLGGNPAFAVQMITCTPLTLCCRRSTWQQQRQRRQRTARWT